MFLFIFISMAIHYTIYLEGQDIEIDVCVDIYRIVDGDTLDAFPVGRVRLADIDAPELGTLEGERAREALINLVHRYGYRAYLDVDNVYVMDRYNRIVAVVYLRYNETHLINVNKWLVENGYASIDDYRNQFNPYTWSLYVYLPHDPCIEKIVTETITHKVTTTVISTIPITTSVTTTVIDVKTVRDTVTKTLTSRDIATVVSTVVSRETTTIYTTYTVVSQSILTKTVTTTYTVAGSGETLAIVSILIVVSIASLLLLSKRFVKR
ncbi:MAG: thermonuclease family protein [Ignisphaera sp.]